uniref:uncharacterized protein LOC103794900 n=1 Tax=Callithrix jacchus TaxID=9483 RepID=UPI0004F04F7B|nr:uncharacterized protein LOC103794900 [Callithrix jacchus]
MPRGRPFRCLYSALRRQRDVLFMEQQRHLGRRERHTGCGLSQLILSGKKSYPSCIPSLSRTRKAENLTGCHVGATRILIYPQLLTSRAARSGAGQALWDSLRESRARHRGRGPRSLGVLTLTPRLCDSGNSTACHRCSHPDGEEKRNRVQVSISINP